MAEAGDPTQAAIASPGAAAPVRPRDAARGDLRPPRELHALRRHRRAARCGRTRRGLPWRTALRMVTATSRRAARGDRAVPLPRREHGLAALAADPGRAVALPVLDRHRRAPRRGDRGPRAARRRAPVGPRGRARRLPDDGATRTHGSGVRALRTASPVAIAVERPLGRRARAGRPPERGAARARRGAARRGRPQSVPFPDDLDPRLWSALVGSGITGLYTHQARRLGAVARRRATSASSPARPAARRWRTRCRSSRRCSTTRTPARSTSRRRRRSRRTRRAR